MDTAAGIRAMLRRLGADEHYNRNQRLARLCHAAWRAAR